MKEYNEIRTDIIAGVYDNHLDDLSRLITERRKELRRFRTEVAKDELSEGDIVTLKNLKPKYINGRRFIIDEINRTKATGRIHPDDINPSKRRTMGILKVPLSALEY